MNEIKIALLQILPGNGLEENLKKGIKACKDAKAQGADIALFPEMFNNGYNIPTDKDELDKQAIAIDHPFIQSFARLAKELELAIGIPFLQKFEPLPKNSICIFDRFGHLVLAYSKVHTCDFGDECRLSAGDDFYVGDLDTKIGNIKIGAMICYDREFPESARILMLKNAEIVFVPNACPMEINRLSQLRARAFENMMGFVTVNYPSPYPDCNGHSTVFDGIAYKPNESASRDTCIVELDESEQIKVVSFPIDELREYRKSEVHGNAYRKPSKYSLLLSEEIVEPFIRNDYRK